MKLPTVSQLRKLGFKVRISHWRYVTNYGFRSHPISGMDLKWTQPVDENNWVQEWVINPLGGETHVTFTDILTKYEFTTVVKCDRRDHYCKRIGNSIAIQRMIEDWTEKHGQPYDRLFGTK